MWFQSLQCFVELLHGSVQGPFLVWIKCVWYILLGICNTPNLYCGCSFLWEEKPSHQSESTTATKLTGLHSIKCSEQKPEPSLNQVEITCMNQRESTTESYVFFLEMVS
jgi:hypothetical protein